MSLPCSPAALSEKVRCRTNHNPDDEVSGEIGVNLPGRVQTQPQLIGIRINCQRVGEMDKPAQAEPEVRKREGDAAQLYCGREILPRAVSVS